jgi:hypothetical protein
VEAVVALNIFEHKDTAGQSEEWLIDSGASVHIVNDYTLLQNPTVYSEPRPLQLATEGVQSAITATGSVCIINSEGKPLWLHNVQYVADANTNLISVSSGIRDGVNLFHVRIQVLTVLCRDLQIGNAGCMRSTVCMF